MHVTGERYGCRPAVGSRLTIDRGEGHVHKRGFVAYGTRRRSLSVFDFLLFLGGGKPHLLWMGKYDALEYHSCVFQTLSRTTVQDT